MFYFLLKGFSAVFFGFPVGQFSFSESIIISDGLMISLGSLSDGDIFGICSIICSISSIFEIVFAQLSEFSTMNITHYPYYMDNMDHITPYHIGSYIFSMRKSLSIYFQNWFCQFLAQVYLLSGADLEFA